MHFRRTGAIEAAETIARGAAIRDLGRLQRVYGKANWRKRKGVAIIRLDDGSLHRAEIHWYEASGVGKREFKIKRLLEPLS